MTRGPGRLRALETGSTVAIDEGVLCAVRSLLWDVIALASDELEAPALDEMASDAAELLQTEPIEMRLENRPRLMEVAG